MRDVLILVALGAALTGCDIDSHAYEKEFHQYYPLKSGGRLSLENYNGSVEIRGWDQERVEIDGVQYGASVRLRDAIQTDVVANGDSVRIRTLRPMEFRGSTGVKYVLKVPRRVNLDRVVTTNGSLKLDDLEGIFRVRTSNGAVRASRLRGDLEVQTSNGPVEVSDLEGPAIIRTTNSRIEARLHKPEPHSPIRLSTTNGGIHLTMDAFDHNDVRANTSNGGITLKLPAQAGARVHAQTSHSSIQSDFDLNSDGKNRLEGTIGGGGTTIDLTTTNGTIKLLKL